MSRKLRILEIITGLTVGGAETFLLHLCRALDKTRFEIWVAYFYDDALQAEFEQIGIKTINLQAQSRNDPAGLINLLRLLQKEKFDIVHTHLLRADWYGAFATLLMTPETPLITSKHDDEPIRKNLLVRKIDRLTAKRAGKVIAISEWEKQFLVRHEGYSPENIVCIHYGLPEVAQLDEQQRIAIRNTLLPEGHNILIGTVGRLVPQKGHIHLLEAIPYVIRAHPEAHFVFAGDGELRGELESAVSRLKINSHVSFLGTRRDVPQFIQALDLFVLPSLWEALGLVLLEAMRASNPVITSACGAIPEIVVDGKTGWLVPPGDSGILAGKIIEAIGKPLVLREFGTEGRIRQQTHFSLDCAVQRIDALYSEFIHE